MGDLGHGVGLVLRGFRIAYSSRRLVLLGALPAVLTSLLFAAGLVALALGIDELVALVTPFAAGWSEALRVTVRVLAGLAIFGAAIAIGVLTFVAVTLLVGGPFYERIGEEVERRMDAMDGVGSGEGLGDPDGPTPDGPRPHRPGRPVLADVGDSVRMIVISLCCGVLLLGIGFLPVVGQVLAPVLGVLAGGWLLTVELVGVAFGARGHGLKQRRRSLRGHRMLAMGFGIPTYLLLVVPLVAILAMPAAVVGGTLLAREVAPDAPDQPEGVGR